MIRNALKYVPWKDKKAVVADLKLIYSANTVEEAEQALENFSTKWDSKYPNISRAWLDKWEHVRFFLHTQRYSQGYLYD